VHFAETLLLAGLVPSIGTVGDALDNALAETTMGLYKTECVRQDSPFRTGPIAGLADLEGCTSAWVHWYNTSRLMHRLGRRPPAEAEAEYYAAHGSGLEADDLHT
jgi:putative transposase